jgi:hypothetical protein
MDTNLQPTLNRMVASIRKGTVIPVISNSFRVEQIFKDDKELIAKMMSDRQPDFYDEVRTIEQQLTKLWAGKINYPMSDDHNLARVAQYHQASYDRELAKDEYLGFLYDRLLKMSKEMHGYESKVDQLDKQPDTLFSDAVQQLDYPYFPEGTRDPLRLLAKLPLPIYITTSYFNFLERALEDEKKSPKLQLCFVGSGKSSVKPEHVADRDYQPDPDHPVVYHLFGLENYSNTLVLSEDDYMNFLIEAVEATSMPDRYPAALGQALTEARLILLGYNLRDWDFRALFRFLLSARKARTPSIAIQIEPNLAKQEQWQRSRRYLEEYFRPHEFSLLWTNAQKFIEELWDAWDNR